MFKIILKLNTYRGFKVLDIPLIIFTVYFIIKKQQNYQVFCFVDLNIKNELISCAITGQQPNHLYARKT